MAAWGGARYELRAMRRARIEAASVSGICGFVCLCAADRRVEALQAPASPMQEGSPERTMQLGKRGAPPSANNVAKVAHGERDEARSQSYAQALKSPSACASRQQS